MINSVALPSVPEQHSPARSAAWDRDGFVNQVAAAALTLLMLGLCTWLLMYLRDITQVHRPYTILYLVPVAIGAAMMGVRGGVAAALIAVILARCCLMNEAHQSVALFSSLPRVSDQVELGSLAVGTLAIALVTGRLRQTLSLLSITNSNLVAANARLTDSEQQRQAFNRDVLLAVTGGKLRLVEPDELPPGDMRHAPPALIQPLRETQDAGLLRHEIHRLAEAHHMSPSRIADLSTSVTEAAANAIKHGGGGGARVWAEADGMWVEIQDRGTGIAPAELARATLEAGFSTRVSLGMGFYMMLQSADTLALCTSEQGTTVFLQVANRPRATEQETLLARYANL